MSWGSSIKKGQHKKLQKRKGNTYQVLIVYQPCARGIIQLHGFNDEDDNDHDNDHSRSGDDSFRY